jgi:hypothetical protein
MLSVEVLPNLLYEATTQGFVPATKGVHDIQLIIGGSAHVVSPGDRELMGIDVHGSGRRL